LVKADAYLSPNLGFKNIILLLINIHDVTLGGLTNIRLSS